VKRKHVVIAALAIGILGMLAYTWFISSRTNTAPDLSVATTTGQKINFSTLSADKPVLVVFWATTCTSCLKEIPHLIELYQELHGKGLELISVTMDYDPPILVVGMIKKRGIPYPVVMDLNKQIMRAFGMTRSITPTTFLIAPGGRIVMHKYGLLDMLQLKQQIVGYL
jgi:peroxiredoxin